MSSNSWLPWAALGAIALGALMFLPRLIAGSGNSATGGSSGGNSVVKPGTNSPCIGQVGLPGILCLAGEWITGGALNPQASTPRTGALSEEPNYKPETAPEQQVVRCGNTLSPTGWDWLKTNDPNRFLALTACERAVAPVIPPPQALPVPAAAPGVVAVTQPWQTNTGQCRGPHGDILSVPSGMDCQQALAQMCQRFGPGSKWC